jgi:hypothetical protein
MTVLVPEERGWSSYAELSKRYPPDAAWNSKSATAQRWQPAHWHRRWGNARFDRYMGGKGTDEVNGEAARIAVSELGAASTFDFGGGLWHFSRRCRELGAAYVAGVEFDDLNSRKWLPEFVDCHFSSMPYPVPWPTNHFDLSFQHNALANLRSSHIEPTVSELARITKQWFLCGYGHGSRFWEGPKVRKGRDRYETLWLYRYSMKAWFWSIIMKYFEVVEPRVMSSGNALTLCRVKHPKVLMRIEGGYDETSAVLADRGGAFDVASGSPEHLLSILEAAKYHGIEKARRILLRKDGGLSDGSDDPEKQA